MVACLNRWNTEFANFPLILIFTIFFLGDLLICTSVPQKVFTSSIIKRESLIVNTDAVQSTLNWVLNSHFHDKRVLIMLYLYYFRKLVGIVWVLDSNSVIL